MPRIKADPVDIAFRAWAQLDDAQKQRLADRVAGYQEARGVVIAPAPRTRQRKVKPDATTNAIAKEHDRLQAEFKGQILNPPAAEDLYSLNPRNPPKGGSGVPLKTA